MGKQPLLQRMTAKAENKSMWTASSRRETLGIAHHRLLEIPSPSKMFLVTTILEKGTMGPLKCSPLEGESFSMKKPKNEPSLRYRTLQTRTHTALTQKSKPTPKPLTLSLQPYLPRLTLTWKIPAIVCSTSRSQLSARLPAWSAPAPRPPRSSPPSSSQSASWHRLTASDRFGIESSPREHGAAPMGWWAMSKSTNGSPFLPIVRVTPC